MLLRVVIAYIVSAAAIAAAEELLIRARWADRLVFDPMPRLRSHLLRAFVLTGFLWFGHVVKAEVPAPVAALLLGFVWMIWYEQTFGNYRWIRLAAWFAGGLALVWF